MSHPKKFFFNNEPKISTVLLSLRLNSSGVPFPSLSLALARRWPRLLARPRGTAAPPPPRPTSSRPTACSDALVLLSKSDFFPFAVIFGAILGDFSFRRFETKSVRSF